MRGVTLEGYHCERYRHLGTREEKEYPKIYPKYMSPSWGNARKIEWKNNDMSFKDKGNYYNDTIRVFL